MPDLFGSKFPLPMQVEKVIFCTALGTIAANTTTYMQSNIKQGELVGGSGVETAQAQVLLILRPGTLRNLVAHSKAAPAGVQTFTYTVRINGVSTTITCVTSGASLDSKDIVNTAKVVAGDRITVQAVTSLTAAVTAHDVCLEIDFTSKRIPFEGINFSSGTTTLAAGATRYLCVLYMRGGGGGYDATVTDNTVSHGCSRKGTLNNLVVYAAAAPGADQTFTYTVMINGIASALTATISGAVAVSAQDLTNVVQIDTGDRVALRAVNSAGGAATTHSAYVEFEVGDYKADV